MAARCKRSLHRWNTRPTEQMTPSCSVSLPQSHCPALYSTSNKKYRKLALCIHEAPAGHRSDLPRSHSQVACLGLQTGAPDRLRWHEAMHGLGTPARARRVSWQSRPQRQWPGGLEGGETWSRRAAVSVGRLPHSSCALLRLWHVGCTASSHDRKKSDPHERNALESCIHTAGTRSASCSPEKTLNSVRRNISPTTIPVSRTSRYQGASAAARTAVALPADLSDAC